MRFEVTYNDATGTWAIDGRAVKFADLAQTLRGATLAEPDGQPWSKPVAHGVRAAPTTVDGRRIVRVPDARTQAVLAQFAKAEERAKRAGVRTDMGL